MSNIHSLVADVSKVTGTEIYVQKEVEVTKKNQYNPIDFYTYSALSEKRPEGFKIIVEGNALNAEMPTGMQRVVLSGKTKIEFRNVKENGRSKSYVIVKADKVQTVKGGN